ncbi:MAG: hypothetical protein JRD89_00775 [Deltaproteobacteria bacterium]|nr:hypothetical protein [Deltaproteobacteria bacterium]
MTRTETIRIRVEGSLYDYLKRKQEELKFDSISETARFLLKLTAYEEKTFRIELPRELKDLMIEDMRQYFRSKGWDKT